MGSREGPRRLRSCSGSVLAVSGVSPPLLSPENYRRCLSAHFTPAHFHTCLRTHPPLTHTQKHTRASQFSPSLQTLHSPFSPMTPASSTQSLPWWLLTYPAPPVACPHLLSTSLPSSERQLCVIQDEVAPWPFPCFLAHLSSHPLATVCAGNQGLEEESLLVLLENSLPVTQKGTPPEGWG